MRIKSKGDGVQAAHCNQYQHAPGCKHAGDGWQRDYTIPPGREKTLPGNLALFSGYVANELGHGELADMQALADFLDSPPVGSVADSFFPRQGVKAKELAARIATVYQEAGVSSLHVEPVGEVLLDRKSVVNSMAHYAQNKWTTPEHKQRVTDAFALIPDVLQKGALVEYGQQMDNPNLRAYIYLAPVQIGKEKCVMAVRIRSSQGQQMRFYLHGIVLVDKLKEQSRGCRDQGSGLDTGSPSGADPRDVFRIAKKAYSVKLKGDGVQAAGDYRDYVGMLTPEATARSAEEWARLEPEARLGKFFLAAVEDEHLLLSMQRLVDTCLQEGVSEAEFIKRATIMLGEVVDPATGRPYYDPLHWEQMTDEEKLAYDQDVQNLDSYARLKLIYRTQSEIAAGYMQWQQAISPDQLQRYPAWQFYRQPGAKIKRADHVAHENEVRLISDIKYWLARNSPDQGGFNVPYPPFGYNSWMRVRPVAREECERLGLLKPGEEVTLPPEMARYGLHELVAQSNTASLASLPQESRQRVLSRCQERGITLQSLPGREQMQAIPPTPDELEQELLELLELLDLAEDPDSLHAAHCNQYGHVPGCPHKGTTREGETKPRKPESLNKKQRERVEVRTLYHYRREAWQVLSQQARERQGAIASGMDKSFHISKESVKELTSGEHVRKSDNPAAHYTAAVNALKLWAHSTPFDPPHDKERDRYNSYEDSPLEWVHYRKAIMKMNGEEYAVRITAKEYKGQSRLPIIYQVKVKKMHGLHVRGAFVVGKTASTVQVDYNFFKNNVKQ